MYILTSVKFFSLPANSNTSQLASSLEFLQIAPGELEGAWLMQKKGGRVCSMVLIEKEVTVHVMSPLHKLCTV